MASVLSGAASPGSIGSVARPDPAPRCGPVFWAQSGAWDFFRTCEASRAWGPTWGPRTTALRLGLFVCVPSQGDLPQTCWDMSGPWFPQPEGGFEPCGLLDLCSVHRQNQQLHQRGRTCVTQQLTPEHPALYQGHKEDHRTDPCPPEPPLRRLCPLSS